MSSDRPPRVIVRLKKSNRGEGKGESRKTGEPKGENATEEDERTDTSNADFPSLVGPAVLAELRGDTEEREPRSSSMASSINKLGFAVLRDLLEKKKSQPSSKAEATVLSSPLSLAVALAMLAEGATGQTRDEIEKWVQLSGGRAGAGAGVSQVMLERTGTVATSLWCRPPGEKPDESYRVDPGYVALLKKKYGADVFGYLSVGAINAWVNEHTGGMIPGLIAELPPNTDFIILNALWFSCPWAKPFVGRCTKNRNFRGLGGNRSCRMMHCRQVLPCATLPNGVVGCVLPLSEERTGRGGAKTAPRDEPKNSDLVMVVAVNSRRSEPPDPEDAEKIAAGDTREVDLWLPRSRLVLPPTSLREVLGKLGLSSCWDERGELPVFGPRARVDDVIQAAKLEFDEKGAKGAAATEVRVAYAMNFDDEPRSRPLEVICDHPFFVGVADRRSGAFVLAGYAL